MHRIGEFSKLSKLTVKTLRYYDEVGLLIPKRVDTTGYRFYETEQLITAHYIVLLRQLGLSISEIQEVMSGNNIREILESQKRKLHEELLTTYDKLSRIESILLKKEDFFMNYQATIKDLPGYTVYYKEGEIKDFSQLTKFILDSAEECKKTNPNLKCLTPDYCYVSYLDPEFKPYDMRIMYAQAVTEMGVPNDTIQFKELEPIQVVSVYHKGDYELLPEAYAFIMNWIKENHYEIVDMPRECYIDGIWNKENKEEWLTEIQVPIQK